MDRRLSIAPMIDWTDRFDRYFLRIISRRCVLYTEMITTGAILHGDRERHLGFDPSEHPVVCQLGGSDPAAMAESARIVEDFGYDEVNINVGCPSDRVQSGRFGACLMGEPDIVGHCVEAMRNAVSIPVTVKCRIGIDDRDDFDFLKAFVHRIREAGCEHLIVHARKAILQGLSPKENREIPPLKYDVVYRVKSEWPDLHVTINGGVGDLDQAAEHLRHVDGVMMGRAAYQTPYVLADADRRIFGDAKSAPLDRHEIVSRLLPFIEKETAEGIPLNRITRHILGLFTGLPGARQWRRRLSERAHLPGAGVDVVLEALAEVDRAASRLYQRPSAATMAL